MKHFGYIATADVTVKRELLEYAMRAISITVLPTNYSGTAQVRGLGRRD